jgi:hypothetical protein
VDPLFKIESDSVSRFLAIWYGAPVLASADVPAAHRLPAPLRDWHAAAARQGVRVTFHNWMVEPEFVEEVDGKLVFWRENQEVYEWGCDPAGADPLVYERSTADGEPWHPTGVRLSDFLVTVTVFEAVMGADDCTYLGPEAAPAALAALRPLPVPGPIFQSQLYAADGVLAFADAKDPARPSWAYVSRPAGTATDGGDSSGS